MCASFFTLLTAVVEVDGTRMSSNSIYDQFVCRIWLTRFPLWNFVSTSSYGILLTTSERYAAVIYHAWYHNNVRTASVLLALHFMLQKSSLFTLLKYRKCRLHYRTDAMPPVILTTRVLNHALTITALPRKPLLTRFCSYCLNTCFYVSLVCFPYFQSSISLPTCFFTV